MANRQEIIDRAEELAQGIANDPKKTILADSDITAETILPHAFRYVIYRKWKEGGAADDLLVDHTIDMTANVGPLPDEVLKQCLDEAYIPADAMASFVDWLAYNRSKFATTQMNYWTVKGSGFYYTGATDPVILRAISMPIFPVDVTDDIDVSDAVIDDVIAAIAAVLRGEIPLSKLTEIKQ